MKQKTTPGFTIIEVSFFLAISGLMAVGLLASAGATINSHRYRDSVVSLQSQLQQEFSKVENVQNARSNDVSCNTSANITTTASNRGTTDCAMLGRFVAVEGDKISSYPVIARAPATANENLNDIEYLKNYIIKIDTTSSAKTDEGRKWGNSITYPSGVEGGTKGDSRNIYFLIVRSPKSGGIYSFSSSTDLRSDPSGLSKMIVDTSSTPFYGRAKQILCVKQEGISSMSPLGVALEANISNPNGIQIISNDTDSGRC